MPDPIADPTFTEDTVHVGNDQAPRIGLAPSRRKSQEEAYLAKLDRERAELSAVLNTEEGQAVIMRVLHECHIYAAEVLSEAAQGRRVLGIKIIQQITALSADSYPNLLIGHAKRQQRLKDAEHATDANIASDH